MSVPHLAPRGKSQDNTTPPVGAMNPRSREEPVGDSADGEPALGLPGRRWSSGAGGDPRVADRGYGGAEGAAEGGAGTGYEVLPLLFADGVPQVAVTASPSSEELWDREGVVVFVSLNRDGGQPGVAEGVAKMVGIAEPLFPRHGLDGRSGVDAEVGSAGSVCG
jgi:hypothetical protein